jgi:hypothetical protein
VNKTLELFQFEVVGVDPATGKRLRGTLNDIAIGDYAAARKKAEQFEAELAQQQPEKKFKVTAVGVERVGPFMQRHMKIVMASAEQSRVAAEMMAARLAELTARDSLELNPNIPQIAERLLDEARKAALLVIKANRAQAPSIVGPDNQPIARA